MKFLKLNPFLFLALIIVLSTFFLTMFFAVNTISVEEILLYEFFTELFQGNSDWKDWFAPQSNHRIFLNRILYFFNLYVGGQIITINVISFFLVLGSCYLVPKVLDQDKKPLNYFLSAVFLFNWFQYETFIHAHTINFNQEIFLGMLVLYAIKNNKKIIAYVSFLLLPFTMLSWGAIIPIICYEAWFSKDKKLIPLLFISLVAIYIYKDAPTTDVLVPGMMLDPQKLFTFFFSLLGSVFGPAPLFLKMQLGVIVLVLSLIVLRQGSRFEKYLIWWGLIHVVMISLGRAHINTANCSRYISYMSVWYLTIVFHFYRIYQFKTKSVVSCGLVFYLLSIFLSFHASLTHKSYKLAALKCINRIMESNEVQCHSGAILWYGDNKVIRNFYQNLQNLHIPTPGIRKL